MTSDSNDELILNNKRPNNEIVSSRKKYRKSINFRTRSQLFIFFNYNTYFFAFFQAKENAARKKTKANDLAAFVAANGFNEDALDSNDETEQLKGQT